MGFDARLQFLHPADAVQALLTVTRENVPGTFNVGADDVVTLTQALRMMGRPTVGVLQPVAPAVAGMVRQARLADFSADQIDAMTYGRGMDISRFAEATGFVPRYTSRQALEEFVSVAKTGLLGAERIEGLLEAVAQFLSPRTGSARG